MRRGMAGGERADALSSLSETYHQTLHTHKLTTILHPDAFDPTTSELTKPAPRAINKIGHALHTLSPQFRAASLSATNAAIGQSLGFQDPRILQSMIICKQPEIGGRVPPHQDSTFLYTDPPSAVGYVTPALVDSRGCGR